MNVDLKKLIRLQAVDLAIQELRAKTEAFPAKSKALDDKLSSALAGVDRVKAAIQNNQARRKELEAKVADLETKISKYRDQLMSVKTNEEYKAMTREIEYSQDAIRAEEDKILALMEESESLAASLKTAQAVLAEDQKTVQSERVQLEALNAQDTGTLDAYSQERTALEKEISEDILAKYERVRRARGGVGIASASHEACDVCNVRMRPQVFQEVRKNDTIITCDSCNRILYDPENLDHPFEMV
jgi:uncharacterized protein